MNMNIIYFQKEHLGKSKNFPRDYIIVQEKSSFKKENLFFNFGPKTYGNFSNEIFLVLVDENHPISSF